MSLHDPDLHVFFDDLEINAAHLIDRVTHSLRRETMGPVIAQDRPWEGTHLAYGSVLPRRDGTGYDAWYLNLPGPTLHALSHAESRDGVNWTKPAHDVAAHEGQPTNIVIANIHGERVIEASVAQAPHGDGFEAYLFTHSRAGGAPILGWSPELFTQGPAPPHGQFLATSRDGVHWAIERQPFLPLQGDRTHVVWDETRATYLLTTRYRNLQPQIRAGVEGWLRDVNLWEGPDLHRLEHKGLLLRPDAFDPPRTQFYSMRPLPYGPGYLGLLEVYHKARERLTTQLAWSRDGHHWQRVGAREPFLTLGGEGSWDSHWVFPTANAPEPVDDRLRFWYTGGANFHGSGAAHRRGIGVASTRRDGFVSMDGGMERGALTTAELDATVPRRLSVNIYAPSSTVDVAVLDPLGQSIEGFTAQDCRVAAQDGVRVPVTWRGGEVVPPHPSGRILLRFGLLRASLFSYRWTKA